LTFYQRWLSRSRVASKGPTRTGELDVRFIAEMLGHREFETSMTYT
jgi:hypothetical protein